MVIPGKCVFRIEADGLFEDWSRCRHSLRYISGDERLCIGCQDQRLIRCQLHSFRQWFQRVLYFSILEQDLAEDFMEIGVFRFKLYQTARLGVGFFQFDRIVPGIDTGVARFDRLVRQGIGPECPAWLVQISVKPCP